MMAQTSVPLPLIAGSGGQQQGYTRQPLSEKRTETELMWLIQVGVLRREVDGQGITDSFRLTPLGRQIVEKWSHERGCLPQPSWRDRILNNLTRWLQWLV